MTRQPAQAPLLPNWDTLLKVGRRAVLYGLGKRVEYLEDVMWKGVRADRRFCRPLLFNRPYLRDMLAENPDHWCTVLRRSWSMVRLPSDAEEALRELSTPTWCDDVGHRLAAPSASRHSRWRSWAAGICNDCHQAILAVVDRRGKGQTWLFFNEFSVDPVPVFERKNTHE